MPYRLVLILITLASTIQAQDITVRTGDHLNFTRIVFTIPPDSVWEVNRSDVGYDVVFEESIQVNGEDFFDRIQRTRVSDINMSEAQTSLSLKLACSCFAEAYLWREDRLVVDIKNEDEPRTEAYGAVNHTYGSVDFATPPLSQIQRLEVSPVISSLTLGPLDRQPIQRSEGLPNPLQDLQNREARILMVEESIFEGLQRAVNQGLLEQNASRVLSEENITNVGGDVAELASLLADINAALTPGLTTRTSIDEAIQFATEQSDTLEPTVSCYPNIYGEMASWATDVPFHHQISNLRSSITREFDKIDSESIEALAKTYISFGFGREAVNILSIDGNSSNKREFLIAVASIIDEDLVEFSGFSRQMACDGPIAIWGFLAHEGGPRLNEVNFNEIVVAFKLLPIDLQRHLAPRLARKLNDAGQSTLAESILSISIEGVSGGTEASIAASEIAEVQGNISAATAFLDELAEDDPRITPAALLRLVALKLENDIEFNNEDLGLVQAIRFESKDISRIKELYVAEVQIHIALSNHHMALALLENNNMFFETEQISRFHDDILSDVTESSTDIEFLELVFSNRITPTKVQLQNEVAERLIQLGFLSKASLVIQEPAFGDEMLERRYLRADIAGRLGRTNEVATNLSGMISPRAEELRLSAGILLDREIVSETSSDAERDISWRQGDWSTLLAQDEDVLMRSIAERLQTEKSLADFDGTSLAQSRTLIDESADLRAELDVLLNRFEVMTVDEVP